MSPNEKKNDLDISNNVLSGIIGAFITVALGAITFNGISAFLIPNNNLLNWRLVFVSIIVCSLDTFVLMWFILEGEQRKHQRTSFERDNFKTKLSISEKRRLTDLITGIPNGDSLKKDITENYSQCDEDVQLIFIDLKNFKEINRKLGYYKANLLLRDIAQTIYNKMRRNEEMYRSNIYRIHTAGDEFVFIIYGDQSEAIGFANRLVGMFHQLSKKNRDILGASINLSFHCGIIKIYKNDTYINLEKKIIPCSRSVKEGQKDTQKNFTMYWDPCDYEKTLNIEKKIINDENKIINVEKMKFIEAEKQKLAEEETTKTEYEKKLGEYNKKLDDNEKKLAEYEKKLAEYDRVRKLFTVMTPEH